MKVGWMWFDNDPNKSLKEKAERAAQAFHVKHGCRPNTCYVNRQALDGDGFTHEGVKVFAAPNILPHHFWLGIMADSV